MPRDYPELEQIELQKTQLSHLIKNGILCDNVWVAGKGFMRVAIVIVEDREF